MDQSKSIRDRIKELRRVPARELLANPRNFRRHPKAQQTAMKAILDEVGFAGALLAREQDDGSLMLIDGHLRAETTPDELVPVLVLDVTEYEANKILLTFDPLSSLATIDQAVLADLTKLTPFDSDELFGLVHSLSDATPDFKPTTEEEQGKLTRKTTYTCPKCGNEFRMTDYDPHCLKCGEFATECISGEELDIAYMEVDE